MTVNGRRELKGAVQFIKDWMLPIAIVLGVSSYLVYESCPALRPIGPLCHRIVAEGQPMLISLMLFLQFVKTAPSDLRFHRWHLWLLLGQAVLFVATALLTAGMDEGTGRIVMECAMLCFICPTAAAAGVITERLGGSLQATIAYVALINALATILIPSVVPLVHPGVGGHWIADVCRIAARIFPMLILPCLLAWAIRFFLPSLQEWLLRYAHWSFYFWGIGLTFAMILSTRALVITRMSFALTAGIVLVSILCCAFQFFLGRVLGRGYGYCEKITAGQALGQKNTGFLIWLGYSFMTPVTSVAGGLYDIWQNLFNSWELYAVRTRGNAELFHRARPKARKG